MGLELFAGKSILDIGCGRTVPQAAMNWLPDNATYVGIDVDSGVLSGLAPEYDGGRIVLRHLDCFHPLSNPKATASLRPAQGLPIPERSFDYILAVNLTSEIGPEDLEAYLQILGRYAHAETRLILNCLLDDAVAKFRYKDPARPYRRSVFSPLYLDRQFAAAGWRVERALHMSNKVFRAVPDWPFADLSPLADQDRPFLVLRRGAADAPAHGEGQAELEHPAEGTRRRASSTEFYGYVVHQLRAAARLGREAETADAMLRELPWSSSRPSAAAFIQLALALARGRQDEGRDRELWREFQRSFPDNESFSKTFVELPGEIRSAYALLGWHRPEDIERSGAGAAGWPFPFAGERPQRPVLVLAPDEQAARRCAEGLPEDLPLELFLWKRTPVRRLEVKGVDRAVRTVLSPRRAADRRRWIAAVESTSSLGRRVLGELYGAAGARPDGGAEALFGSAASEPLREVLYGAQELLEDIRAGAYAKVALVCRGAEDLDSVCDMLALLRSLDVEVALWFPDQSIRDRNAMAARFAVGGAAVSPSATSADAPGESDWAVVRGALDGGSGDRASSAIPEDMVLRRAFRGRDPRLGAGAVVIVASLEDSPIDLGRLAQGLGEASKVVVVLVDSSRRAAESFVQRMIEAGPMDLDVLLLDPRSLDQEVATLKPALTRVGRHLFRTMTANGGLTIDGAPLGPFLSDWWDLAFVGPLARMLLQRRFMGSLVAQYEPRLVIAGPASEGDVAPAIAVARARGTPVIALRTAWPGMAGLDLDVTCLLGPREAELYSARPAEGVRRLAAFATPRVAPRVARFGSGELRADLRCGRKDKAIVFAASDDADASHAALEAVLDGLSGKSGFRLLVKAHPSLPLSEAGRIERAVATRGLGERCVVLRDYSIYRLMAGAELLIAHVTAPALLFEAMACGKPVLGVCLDGEDRTGALDAFGAAALTDPAGVAGRLELFLNSAEAMTGPATGSESILAGRPELRDAELEGVLLAEAARLAGRPDAVG